MNRYFENAQQAFEVLYAEIEETGVAFDGTRALFNVGFTLKNPSQNLILTPWRKWSLKYAHREWDWYVRADPSVLELAKHAPIWLKHADDQGRVNSNYGFQWNRNQQLSHILDLIYKKRETRQAWVSIYDGKEWQEYARDTPCTLNVGFSVVENKVNMCVLMRSNDLFFGFCNDQYCFSNLQQYVADCLNLPVGTYFHFAHNLHLYPEHQNLMSHAAPKTSL